MHDVMARQWRAMGLALVLLLLGPLVALAQSFSNGSFEQGFTGWRTSSEGTGGTYSKRIVTWPTLTGRYAAEFTLRVTSPDFTILRNEITLRDIAQLGSRYVYEFGQFVPSDFATSPLFIETAQFLPNQQHLSTTHAYWGPVLAVGIRKGRWELKAVRDVDGEKITTRLDLGTVSWNRWARFTIEVLWSATRTGDLRVYKDGRQVLNRSGATTFPDGKAPYFRWGMYTRRVWTLGGKPAPPSRFRIVHDGFSVQKIPQGGPQ